MTQDFEAGVNTYRVVGTRLLAPSGEQIALIVRRGDGARPNDLVVPVAKAIRRYGTQTRRTHGSVRSACRYLAQKHRNSLRFNRGGRR